MSAQRRLVRRTDLERLLRVFLLVLRELVVLRQGDQVGDLDLGAAHLTGQRCPMMPQDAPDTTLRAARAQSRCS